MRDMSSDEVMAVSVGLIKVLVDGGQVPVQALKDCLGRVDGDFEKWRANLRKIRLYEMLDVLTVVRLELRSRALPGGLDEVSEGTRTADFPGRRRPPEAAESPEFRQNIGTGLLALLGYLVSMTSDFLDAGLLPPEVAERAERYIEAAADFVP